MLLVPAVVLTTVIRDDGVCCLLRYRAQSAQRSDAASQSADETQVAGTKTRAGEHKARPAQRRSRLSDPVSQCSRKR